MYLFMHNSDKYTKCVYNYLQEKPETNTLRVKINALKDYISK